MTEIELNQEDRENIRADIKLTLIFAFIICALLVTICVGIPVIMYFLGKSVSDGFLGRLLFIGGLFFSFFLFISWTNLLKYIDLRKGKKFRLELSKYQIQKKRQSVIIRTFEPRKLKFEVFTDVDSRIDINQPVTIEFVPTSKMILFISNHQTNSLDKFDAPREINDNRTAANSA